MGRDDEPTQTISQKGHCDVVALVIGDGNRSTRHLLRSQPLSIGSNSRNDLVLRDPAVSGRHCRLAPEGRGWIVRDLQSRNGTFVNGLRVREAELRPGCRLQLGRTIIRSIGASDRDRQQELVAVSARMLAVLSEVDGYAGVDWPILILGESGSGKEGIARALHDRGPRAGGPLLP